MADIKKEDVLTYLENANMLEISELIKEIEEKFGVTAAVPVAIAGGAAQAGSDAGSEEEKTEFGFSTCAATQQLAIKSIMNKQHQADDW